MRLSQLAEGDVASVVAAWNTALPYDHVTEAEFRRVLLQDPNYEPEAAQVARADDGSVLGLGACVLRRTPEGKDGGGHGYEFERGHLKVFFVLECPARDEIADALLAAAESYCAEAEKQKLSVTQYTGPYFFPGIDVRYERLRDMLAARGYRDIWTLEDVAVDLRNLPIERRLAAARERAGPAVELLTWHPDLLPAMRRFVEEEDERQWFPVGWEAQAQWSQPREVALVLRRGGEIVGWAQYWPGVPRAGFGPTLVLRRERGKGYGALLLLECMQRARQEGSERMSAGWANTGFYVACGWHISRRYAVLVKDLRDGS
jgi:GNAT superfamily N-acetyltransferase